VREAAQGLAERATSRCADDLRPRPFHLGERLPTRRDRDGLVTIRRFATFRTGTIIVGTGCREAPVGDQLDDADELAWSNGPFASRTSTCTLGHASEYAAIVFSPYLFWTTLYCAGIAPSGQFSCLPARRAVRVSPIRRRRAGSAPRLVSLRAEHQLAHRSRRLLPTIRLSARRSRYPSLRFDGFRKRTTWCAVRLVCGQTRGWEGWQELMAGFGLAVRPRPAFDLVTVGVGHAQVPSSLEHRIVDLDTLRRRGA